MTRANHVVLCGRALNPRSGKSDEIIQLDLLGEEANIDLEITDISRRLSSDVPDVLTDLIEIATYVYCADQAVTRGEKALLTSVRTGADVFTFTSRCGNRTTR